MIKILVIYIYIILFGGWIFNIIGIPMAVGTIILSVLDFLPLLLFIVSNPTLKIRSKSLFVNSINYWITLLFILFFTMCITALNSGVITFAVVQFGTIIRYMPLAYFVVRISNNNDISKYILSQYSAIAAILLSITFISILIGPDRATIFLPYLSEGSTAERTLVDYHFSAVFENTIDLSFILLLLYSVICTHNSITNSKKYFISIIFAIAVFFTGSLISFIVLLFVIMLNSTKGNPTLRWTILIIITTIIISLLINYWDIIELVYENAKLSRIGLLTSTLPEFITRTNLDTFIGYGSDPYVIVSEVNKLPTPVYIMQLDAARFYLGDVYWVYIMLSYGVIGLCLIVYLFYKSYRSCISTNYCDNTYDYKNTVNYLYIAIIIISLFNQIIATKTFSILFWVYMGLVYTKNKSISYNGKIRIIRRARKKF